ACSWPMNSSRDCGRIVASKASVSRFAPVTRRSVIAPAPAPVRDSCSPNLYHNSWDVVRQAVDQDVSDHEGIRRRQAPQLSLRSCSWTRELLISSRKHPHLGKNGPADEGDNAREKGEVRSRTGHRQGCKDCGDPERDHARNRCGDPAERASAKHERQETERGERCGRRTPDVRVESSPSGKGNPSTRLEVRKIRQKTGHQRQWDRYAEQ